MGIMIIHHENYSPMYNVHKNLGVHYTQKNTVSSYLSSLILNVVMIPLTEIPCPPFFYSWLLSPPLKMSLSYFSPSGNFLDLRRDEVFPSEVSYSLCQKTWLQWAMVIGFLVLLLSPRKLFWERRTHAPLPPHLQVLPCHGCSLRFHVHRALGIPGKSHGHTRRGPTKNLKRL